MSKDSGLEFKSYTFQSGAVYEGTLKERSVTVATGDLKVKSTKAASRTNSIVHFGSSGKRAGSWVAG